MSRKSIAGGICIGLAALANMLAPHPVIGAILFCFGLFAILANDFKLCTGMFGNCKSFKDWLNALGVFVSNYWGASLIGIFALLCGWELPKIVIYDANLWTVLYKSILCGAMIHIGVKSYKNGYPLVMFLSVALFVLCGMEHCVANTFLLLFSSTPDFLPAYGINIIGNAVGAKIMDYFLS